MVHNQKKTGRASSVPAGLLAGAVVSAVITVSAAVLIAILLDAETIAWEMVGYGVLLVILLSSYLGALIAYRKIRRQKLVICMLSGIIYFGILLMITALFFGGKYEAVGVTALLVAGGSACAAMTGTGEGRRRGKHYSVGWYC